MTTDRRNFIAMAAGAALVFIAPAATSVLPVSHFSPVIAARMLAMQAALAAPGVSDAFQQDAIAHARDCVEAAFMTPCASAADEDAVMMALDAYEKIYPNAFAMQSARDLFTPRQYQTYPLDRLRHWLLTDPDEDFAKSGMPAFLRRLREGAAA